jgi:hypothetical protein
MTKAISTLDTARRLYALGFNVIPVKYGQKVPTRKNWPALRLDLDQLAEAFAKRLNIGVLTGPASGGLVVVDLDNPQALTLADEHLPATCLSWGRAGKPRAHRVFRVVGDCPSRSWDGAAGRIVDLLAGGRFALAPGSVHPCGELVEFAAHGQPGEVTAEHLVSAVESLVVAVKAREADVRLCDRDSPPVPPAPVALWTQRPSSPASPASPASPVNPLTPAQVVHNTTVTGRGQHNKRSFDLARGLRINCQLSQADAVAHFWTWWTASKPFCREQDDDVALEQFLRDYDNVLHGLGEGVAAQVLKAISTLQPPPDLEGRVVGTNKRLLICAMYAIGERVGREPFALSCHMAAKALGISPEAADKLISSIARDGLIEVVHPGRPGAGGTGRARRLRWLGSLHAADPGGD